MAATAGSDKPDEAAERVANGHVETHAGVARSPLGPVGERLETVERPANPIAATSQWMAAARARESERADCLFCDPLAAPLAGPEGFAWLDRMESTAWSDGPGLYPVIRTRFFDDFLLGSCGG